MRTLVQTNAARRIPQGVTAPYNTAPDPYNMAAPDSTLQSTP
jgi:hypothetical protein